MFDRKKAVEARKEDLEISIAREQMFKPLLEPKKIKFFLHQFRKLDTTKLEHRKILVDSFLNGLVLYDDHIDFYFNYKDGTETITLTELESEEKKTDKSSNLISSAQPNEREAHPKGCAFSFALNCNIGIRTRRERRGRKQSGGLFSPTWATSECEAIGAVAPEKSLFPSQIKEKRI